MNYTTYNLKYESYVDFYTACDENGLVIDDNIIKASHNHCLDLIGTLYSETGETLTDDAGNEYAETEAIEGYHVNLRCKELTGLESAAIEVATPQVKFAGE